MYRTFRPIASWAAGSTNPSIADRLSYITFRLAACAPVTGATVLRTITTAYALVIVGRNKKRRMASIVGRDVVLGVRVVGLLR